MRKVSTFQTKAKNRLDSGTKSPFYTNVKYQAIKIIFRLLYNIRNNRLILPLFITAVFAVLLLSSSTMSKQLAALTQKNNATLDHLQNNNPIKTTSNNNNLLLYENPILGIKMQYPSNWLKNATGQGVTFVLPIESSNNLGTFLAKVDVTIITGFPPNMPLKAMADGVLNGYKRSLPNFQLESYMNTTLAGNPAAKIVYMFTDSKGGNLTATDIGAIKNNRLYVVQYVVPSPRYQSYLSILQKMTDSFTIIK